jgi:UDPglucose 6-dehydrogenase
MKKIAMIGVGKLGQDCAEVMADAGYDVVGYDIEPRLPLFPMMNSIEEAVKDRDIIFIAAPTPHDPVYGGETPTSHLPNKDFDYSILTNILNEVNNYVNKNQLVVLISTVLPGTVRNHLKPCITNARFIYNPYLIAMGTIKWDMVNPEMIIIGTEDGSMTGDAKELIDFYRVFMVNDPRYEVGTWDEAESIKIFYNTFISTKLALVNMIQDVAETNGNINVDIVTDALAKSTHRIMGPAYMKAGLGDAGACHPRDNIALRFLADRLDLGYDLFDSIMTAREVQAERMALRCLKNGRNITIIGKAYKPKVPYTNGSASMLVGHYIEKHGGNVKYYDINTGDLDLKPEWTEVYLIGYYEDWVIETLNRAASWDRSIVVIDPWRQLSDNHLMTAKFEIIDYGNSRPKNVFGVKKENYSDWTHNCHTNVFGLWPELKKHIDMIHIIDAEVGETNFIGRPTELIVEEILEAAKNGKTKFLFNGLSEGYQFSLVDKIHRIGNILENKIDSKNLIYLTSAFGVEKTYPDMFANKLSLNANWKNKISILSTHAFHFYSSYHVRELKYMVNYTIKEKSKDFLCFNKVPRDHRVKLLDRMLEHNMLNKSYYSFEGDSDWLIGVPDEFKSIKLNESKFPIRLNITPERLNPAMLEPEDLKYFDDSYFSVVTETTFYSNHHSRRLNYATVPNSIFITEKTFKCIPAMHPFIIFSCSGILAELRRLGYKTFAPLIDETYDTIINDDDRFEAIWQEILRLIQKTPEEWIQWQTAIKEIVEFNKNHFYSDKTYFATPIDDIFGDQ